jgi:HSP20 family protein
MNGLFSAADLFQEMDRLQRQFFRERDGFPSSLRATRFGAFPQINVGSTDDSVEIVAFVPGMNPEDIEVTIDKGLLTIAGERKMDGLGSDGESQSYARERFIGSFRRAIELPRTVDPDKVTARYLNGCLSISIGKQEASRPRAISIA